MCCTFVSSGFILTYCTLRLVYTQTLPYGNLPFIMLPILRCFDSSKLCEPSLYHIIVLFLSGGKMENVIRCLST
ncbi:hypothetical protein K450DRAFT_227693 [Umbelopsis ramanniana AG]|uniref:Uncharacterized protein n=1 Tax=Umbelopsis ramanniana AG TaxID=1314678 RepID=A0AAD5EF45_UMBRA|nr:uncharacterized protein K450DRAFT_227693 [Umbelopsis ramanniana AG]KAI8582548.1 hypothetical protein K450DRAFT_227693 [Umbelopsis ramanniana AG]